jgi:hypothetical protein
LPARQRTDEAHIALELKMPTGIPVAAVGRTSPRCRSLLVVALAAACVAGCEQDEAIVVEQVPKDSAARVDEVKPTPKTDRMLAAIVPHADTAYFFKLTGPIDEVASLRPEFLGLLRSLTFEAEAPKWELPEGWSQDQGSPGRIATITIPGNPPLSISVTSLAMPKEGLSQYLLANVNRWRGQMGLADLDAQRLEAAEDPHGEIFKLKLADGAEAILVDFAGHFSGGMTPPFAGNAGGTGDRPRSAPPKPAYDLPEGWKVAPEDGVSTVAFESNGATTSVTALPARNELLANVNRWRAQVGLEPFDAAALDDALKSIPLGDGGTGKYVTLVDPEDANKREAILGVIAIRGDTAWFVKMKGDAEAVLPQQAKFEEFVKSLKFSEDAH